MSQNTRQSRKGSENNRPAGPNAADPNRLIEDYQKVAEQLGRVPTRSEYIEHGNHAASTIEAHFGSISEARDLAGLADIPSHATKHTRELLYERSEYITGGDH